MMFSFITYMIKAGIGLALVYLLFKLLLSKDSRHAYKRVVLLISIGAAFVIPLLAQFVPVKEISSTSIVNVRELIELPLIETVGTYSTPTIAVIENNSSYQINWAILLYWFILSVLCLRFLISYQSIFKWLKRARIKPYKDILLAIVNDSIQAFSFWKYIVLSKEDYQHNKTPILLHEEAHLKLHHTIDVVFIELVCYLQWFNPFVWLLKKELKLVHEFQADQAVLNSGIDATQYQLLILEKAVGKRRFASANHFKQGSISKRLKMMKKKQILRWSVAKTLFFLPAGFLLLQAFSNPEVNKKVDTLPKLIAQTNDSENWLNEWRYDNIANLNAGIFFGKQPVTAPDLSWKNKPIKKRNVLAILQNKRGALLVNGELVAKTELKAVVKSFLNGKDYWSRTNPEIISSKLSNGTAALINQIAISYQVDRGTPKESVAHSMKAIGKAYLEVRSERAQEIFKKDYFDLSEAQKLEIDERVPVRMAPFTAITPSKSAIQLIVSSEGIFINKKICPIDKISERVKVLMQNNGKTVAEIRVLDSPLKKEKVEKIKNQLLSAGIKRINYSGMITLNESEN